MVLIPAGKFRFKVSGVEIEGGDDPGVDVQYPWEDLPRRHHDKECFCLLLRTSDFCGSLFFNLRFVFGENSLTGPLTKKRMETIDEEVLAATTNFLERATKADKTFSASISARLCRSTISIGLRSSSTAQLKR